MPVLKSILFGLVIAFAATAGAMAQGWSEYRPAEGRYRIEMPGTPEEETVPTPVQGEKVPMMQAMVAESDVVYLVGYIDYPAEAMEGHDPAKALEAARDGVAKGHKLLSDRALAVSGQPAREFVIEQPKGLVLVMRIVFVGERLYQMVVVTVTPGGTADRRDTRRFIDSFRLDPPPAK